MVMNQAKRFVGKTLLSTLLLSWGIPCYGMDRAACFLGYLDPRPWWYSKSTVPQIPLASDSQTMSEPELVREVAIRPKLNLSVYMLGGEEDEILLALSAKIPRKTEAPREASQKSSSDVFLSEPHDAQSYLTYFEDNVLETRLMVQNMDQCSPTLWGDFFSKIYYLDHLASGDNLCFVDVDTLAFMADHMPASNLQTITFPATSLAIGNKIELGIGALRKIFAKNTTLKAISINFLPGYSDYPTVTNLFHEGPHFPHLTHFNLLGANVDDQGFGILAALFQGSPFLSHVAIGGGTLTYTKAGLLALCEVLLTRDKLDHFQCILPDSESSQVVTKILEHSNLKSLEVRGSESSFGLSSFKEIGRALAESKSVSKFTSNFLTTPVKAFNFFAGLQGNLVLEYLDLDIYDYGKQGMGDDGLRTLAYILKVGLPITHLKLKGSNVTTVGTRALDEAIRVRLTPSLSIEADWSPQAVSMLSGVTKSGKVRLNTIIN